MKNLWINDLKINSYIRVKKGKGYEYGVGTYFKEGLILLVSNVRKFLGKVIVVDTNFQYSIDRVTLLENFEPVEITTFNKGEEK